MEKIDLNKLISFEDTFTLKHLIDIPEVQVNLVCLASGQSLPAHIAEFNIRVLVLSGELTVVLNGETNKLNTLEMGTVEYGTPTQIMNPSDVDTAFLVIKIQHTI